MEKIKKSLQQLVCWRKEDKCMRSKKTMKTRRKKADKLKSNSENKRRNLDRKISKFRKVWSSSLCFCKKMRGRKWKQKRRRMLNSSWVMRKTKNWTKNREFWKSWLRSQSVFKLKKCPFKNLKTICKKLRTKTQMNFKKCKISCWDTRPWKTRRKTWTMITKPRKKS